MERYKQPHMDLHPDGEWIRYADHCEAMKRIAAAAVEQGPRDADIEAWAEGFIRAVAYNRSAAVQIATEAAKWVRSVLAANRAKKLDGDLLETIREAAKMKSEGAITKDGRAVFINYGDSEQQMIDAAAVACPACGGSGHVGDVSQDMQRVIKERLSPSVGSYANPIALTPPRQMVADSAGEVERDWSIYVAGPAGYERFETFKGASLEEALEDVSRRGFAWVADEDGNPIRGMDSWQGPRVMATLPSPTEMADALAAVQRGATCPLCGWNYPHEHSPKEIIIYRNGVKFGHKSTQPWTGADNQGIAEVAPYDAGRVGEAFRAGADEHHEYRDREADTHQQDDCRDSSGHGVRGACELSASSQVGVLPAPIPSEQGYKSLMSGRTNVPSREIWDAAVRFGRINAERAAASPAPTDAQIIEIGRNALDMQPAEFAAKIRELFAGASPAVLTDGQIERIFYPAGSATENQLLIARGIGRAIERAALAAQPPAAAEAEDKWPDMLWGYDDPESGPSSTAEDFAENFASQGMMAGDESIVRVQCAKSMPDRMMLIRVSKDPEAKDWLHWEWINAAMTATPPAAELERPTQAPEKP